MAAGRSGAPHGSVFLSDEQTAGRGRGNHSWHSHAGEGLYVSVLLRPPMAIENLPVVPLAAGLAAAWAIKIAAGMDVDLRWPNDLLIGPHKCGGILVESKTDRGEVGFVVIGIGINVNQLKFPEDLRDIATSLRLVTGNEWSRVELATALLKSLHREYRDLLENSNARESILRRFTEHSSYARGCAVRIDENGRFEGVTEGMDSRGFLRVRTTQGLRTVLSGTVTAV